MHALDYWWLREPSYVVAFGILPYNFGRWRGPTNVTLLLHECSFSGGNTLRWLGNSNPTCCNIISLNFLHSQLVRMWKDPFHAHSWHHACLDPHAHSNLYPMCCVGVDTPPSCTPPLLHISGGVSMDYKSSIRNELSPLVQELLNLQWFDTPTHPHIHMWMPTLTHAHAHAC